MKRKNLPWFLTIALALLTTILSFTSLAIPEGKYLPMVMGLPYSLFTGITATLILVALTFLATRVHPAGRDAIQQEKLKKENHD